MHRNTKHSTWQQHLAEWEASGLSQAAYCREHDLSAVTFSWWKRRLREPDKQQSFVELPLAAMFKNAYQSEPEGQHSSIRIQWPNGVSCTVNGTPEPGLLAAVFELAGRS